MRLVQIVVNPESAPEAASKASKQPAEAQAKENSDRKQKEKVTELDAKQPGTLA